MDGRHRERVTQPELVELRRQVLAPTAIHLVGDQQHRGSGPAQQVRDVAVDRSKPLADVDHEQDAVRLFDGQARLLFHPAA